MEGLDIAYTGLGSATADLDCRDGELSICHNVENRGGSLRPVVFPKADFVLKGGETIVYLHRMTGSDNYLYVDQGGRLCAFRMEHGVRSEVEVDGSFVMDCEGLDSCHSFGNTVVVVTKEKMMYLLYKASERKYVVLGDHLPEMSLSFGLVAFPQCYSQLDGGSGEKYGAFTVSFDAVDEATFKDVEKELSETNQGKVTEQVMAKVNKFVKEAGTDKNRFFYPFFVRYAYRLYDGSLTMHSAPVLMVPASTRVPLAMWTAKVGGGSVSSVTMDLYGCPCDLYVRMNTDPSVMDGWSDVIRGVDVFVSQQLYPTDSSKMCTTFHDLESRNGYSLASLKGHGKFGYVSLENSYYEKGSTVSAYTPTSLPEETLRLPAKDTEQWTEEIRDCGLFYLWKHYELKDLKEAYGKSGHDAFLVDVEDGRLENLVLKERMTDDYRTHERVVPGTSFLYNSRLNIANICRELFGGFMPSEMCCLSGWVYKRQDYTDEETETGWTAAVPSQSSRYVEAYSYVTLESGGEELTMCSGHRTDSALCRKIDPDVMPYLFYPLPNVKEMYVEAGDEAFRAVMQNHKSLNGSVWFDGFGTMHPASTEKREVERTDTFTVDSNKIYTSEVGNPYYFPLSGIETVGTGDIVGIRPVVKAMSEGQFGVFPLIVFATDGIWAMTVDSSSGLFSSKQRLSLDVCVNSRSLVQTSGLVFFASERGMLCVDGSSVQCVSSMLDGPLPDLGGMRMLRRIVSERGLDDELSMMERPCDFFRICRSAYDYTNSRLLFFHPDKRYAYVFGLDDGMWSTVSSDFTYSAQSWPDFLLQRRDGGVVNINQPVDYDSMDRVRTFVLTRPLKFGSDMLKTVNSVVNRMRVSGEGGTVLFASMDGERYVPISSTVGTRITGRGGSPYRFFRLLLSYDMGAQDSVSRTSVYVTGKRPNRK